MLVCLGYKHEITHIFSFGYMYSLLMQPLRLIKRIPASVFVRADALENHKLKGRSRWLLVLEQLFEGFGIANVRCYGVSDSLTNSITSRHRYLKPKYAGTLRNDIEQYPQRRNAKHNLCFPLKLAIVGILEKRKNQHFLLEVFENLDPQKAQLYLYGMGPEETKLKQTVKEKCIDKHVHFMGWVKPPEIWQNTDLLLMPSLHEGAPNSVLEAMSYEVPVLASDIPEHREILPEANLLLLDNPEIWAERLSAIIENPAQELKKLIDFQKPYADCLTFDWDREICECILKG
jgi:glycosyltransferase involved in cell wall biosynthesis